MVSIFDRPERRILLWVAFSLPHTIGEFQSGTTLRSQTALKIQNSTISTCTKKKHNVLNKLPKKRKKRFQLEMTYHPQRLCHAYLTQSGWCSSSWCFYSRSGVMGCHMKVRRRVTEKNREFMRFYLQAMFGNLTVTFEHHTRVSRDS